MTTLARQVRAAHAAHAGPDAARPVVVRWSIARAAAGRARPDLVPSPAGPPVDLEWRAAPDGAGLISGQAAIIDAQRTTVLLSLLRLPGCWRRDERGIEHVDVPGLLAVSLAPGGRILFARTAIFALWNIPGGRYELALPPRG